MGGAMTVGLLMGGLNAASSLISNQQQAQVQAAQAKSAQAQYDAQAKSLERQAQVAAESGRVEAENIERQKVKLRREFEDNQARNRSLLAAGNVDMGSGSAADTAAGNINLFAADIGDNAYQKAMKEWETKTNVDGLKTQADNARATAGFYGEQASRAKNPSLFPSLLSAAISGAGGFASGYSLAGGRISNWFGKGDTPKKG